MVRIRHIVLWGALVALAATATAAQAPQPYRLSDEQMKGLLERLEKSANKYRDRIRGSLDRSRLDDTRAEDNIKQLVDDFENATDRLKDHFDGRQSAAGDVEEVLRRAARIDSFMQRHPLVTRADREWLDVRRHLDELARAYNVSWDWGGLSDRPYRISDREMKFLLERIKKSGNRFRDSLRRALKQTRFDDTRAEDNINQFIKDFVKATERLEDHFDDRKSVVADVEEVLRRATNIDLFVQRHRLAGRAQSDWGELRRQLEELARAYNVSWS